MNRIRLPLAAAVLAVAAAASTPASAAGLSVDAQVRAGAVSRPARVLFSCTQNGGAMSTGVLSVELQLADAAALGRVFPLDDFEGPSAPTTKSVTLRSLAGREAAFMPSGWWDERMFHLAVNGALRNDAPKLKALADVVASLGLVPSSLVWDQASTKPNGPRLTAEARISPEDAQRLLAAVKPCLDTARRR
ncbi:conserved exported protein of unknown function [Rhodovastum atsumiense]|uniref:Uncharacterized protein n=1 Tax=Rhodovastum atsumiense TaxID=504468 RepID=A0A5M6IML1_9PROT|nr:hypothetical protein [Rhodovastum atsumiense]KAA5609089.1 hypothetical protein F1189_26030 [Rhodovastum atsumiense]CAH2602157.1 conserved exported protein of unknown function [Rhodovastum atsumiense]